LDKYREVGISSGNQALTRCAFVVTDGRPRRDSGGDLGAHATDPDYLRLASHPGEKLPSQS
jgi:hypothetical protein